MSLNVKEFTKHIPSLENDVNRYNLLTSSKQSYPTIAVFGKFNHGKSTLLNALISKKDFFAASDKRETVVNKEFNDDKNQITWLDTPGLDADVTQKDDHEAHLGIAVKADMVLFVHNIKAGELDKSEVEHFKKLATNFGNKPKILVLTQIDQVDAQSKDLAIKQIKKQFSGFKIFEVSALRYLRGVEEKKDKFIELSGITNLLTEINSSKKSIIIGRNTEISNLKSKIVSRIKDEISLTTKKMDVLKNEISSEKKSLSTSFQKLFEKVHSFN